MTGLNLINERSPLFSDAANRRITRLVAASNSGTPDFLLPRGRLLDTFNKVGTWLSLVEHSVRDAGVGGSNPLVPTIFPGR
jgi:hypothetical protein